jgi:hypothetical protein
MSNRSVYFKFGDNDFQNELHAVGKMFTEIFPEFLEKETASKMTDVFKEQMCNARMICRKIKNINAFVDNSENNYFQSTGEVFLNYTDAIDDDHGSLLFYKYSNKWYYVLC